MKPDRSPVGHRWRPRVGAANRPTLRATILVALGAAGTLGAALFYEASRSGLPEASQAPWIEANRAPAAMLASVGNDAVATAAAPAKNAGAGRAGEKTEILFLGGSLVFDGKGVANAFVYAIPASSPVVPMLETTVGVHPDVVLGAAQQARTDDAGRFSIQTKLAGEYVVFALAEGAAPAVARAAAGTTDLRIEAEAPRAITGRVVDSEGRPVTKAVAIAMHSRTVNPDPAWPVERKVAFAGFRRFAETDSNGQFDLRGLDEGPFTLIVSAPELAAAKLLGVRPGAAPVTVTLQPGATLAGIVTDDQQKPVANAGVALARLTADGRLEESDDVTTDAKGAFATTHAIAGGVGLVAKVVANGYATSQIPLAPLAPGERRQQNVTLEPAATLVVRVLGPNGAPAAGAIAEAYESVNRTFLKTLTTDENGIARFEAASPARKYRVLSIAEGCTLGVCPEATTKEVAELVLKRACAVEGQLVGEGGAPVAGTVQLHQERDNEEIPETFSVKSGVEGHFRFEGLGSGVYTLVAQAPGLAPAKIPRLQVAEGLAPLRVTLSPGLSWQGRVVNRSGQPVENVIVQVADHAPNSARVRGALGAPARTDGSGAFLLQGVPAEAKCVTLSREGALPRAARIFANPASGGIQDVGELVFEEGGSVAGRVVDRNGLPLAGATVVLLAGDLVGTAAPSCVTAADGSFKFQGVPAGAYALDVHDPVALAIANAPTRVATEVQVRDNETTQVSIDARRFGRLYGRVRVRGSISPVDLDIVLRRPHATVQTVAETRVTWSGSYEMPIPGPGEYLLEVWSMQGPAIRAARGISLGMREERAIDLEIGDAAIAGTVRAKETGLPVPGATIRIATEDGALWTVVADGAGRFQADGLPATAAEVSAIAAGFSASKASKVSFATARSASMEIELDRGSELVVRAVASAGPLAGARVSLWSDRKFVAEAMTNQRGEASWESLPSARYEISVEHAQYEGYRSGTEVVAGSRVEASVEMRRTGAVVALVRTKAGAPVSGLPVALVSAAGLRHFRTTDAFGSARFDAVSEGAATLEVADAVVARPTVRAGDAVQVSVER